MFVTLAPLGNVIVGHSEMREAPTNWRLNYLKSNWGCSLIDVNDQIKLATYRDFIEMDLIAISVDVVMSSPGLSVMMW